MSADLDAAVERVLAGDRRAFADVYRHLSGPLLTYLHGRVRRRDDAEDLLGQVFLEAMRGIDRFRGDAAGFRAWLFRIARDRAIDVARGTDRRREEPIEAAADVAAPATAESEAIDRLERTELWDAVRRLPEAQREVIVLRLGSGLSSSEIAAVVGKQVNAVKALQHRALANLARDLAGEVRPVRPAFPSQAVPEGPSEALED